MATKVHNTQALIDFIHKDYPKAIEKNPTPLQKQFVFSDDLILNIFTTTSKCNFQGSQTDETIKSRLLTQIELINTSPNQ